MVHQAVDVTAGAGRVAPIRTDGPGPPLRKIFRIDRTVGFPEHQGSRLQEGIRRPGGVRRKGLAKGFPIQGPLRFGAIAGGLRKGGKLAVGYLVDIHKKGGNPHRVAGQLVRLGLFGLAAHQKLAAGDISHSRRGKGRIVLGAAGEHQTQKKDRQNPAGETSHPQV